MGARMSLWPDRIVLDGVELPLAGILADLTIRHGRREVLDEATAATCQISLLGVAPAFVAGFRVGAPLTITASDGITSRPRFTGTVTDAALDVDELTAIAVGRIATLRRYAVGAVAWPVEAWSARIARLFAEAGLSAILDLRPDPLFDPELAARNPATAGPTTLGDYLAFLAPMVGAAVADQPDGTILVQALGARTLEGAHALTPATVAYAPVWEQALPPANIVTVRYTGDQSLSVTVRDDTSVALYGQRPRTVDTTFVAAADATHRANEALGRGAFAHWNVPAAPVLEGLELAVGQAIELSSLPPSAPFDPWTPILEGWTDTIAGAEWRMALSLSDPLASGLLVPWNSVPPGELWTTIDQAIAWRDARTLDALIGA
jgi:hypothetical protein